MRRKGSAQRSEQRRLRAIEQVKHGRKQADVAREHGVNPRTVRRWKEKFDEGGRKALLAKRHPGPTEKLSASQRKQLVHQLLHPPVWGGYRWTLTRVQHLILKEFGVAYEKSSVRHLLARLGWRCQKPDHKPTLAEEQAWRQKLHAEAAKNGGQDDGFLAMLQASRKYPPPQRHSTWVPR